MSPAVGLYRLWFGDVLDGFHHLSVVPTLVHCCIRVHPLLWRSILTMLVLVLRVLSYA